MAILHFQSSLFCNWLELVQLSFSVLWQYEIGKLTFIAIFSFLGFLTFVSILLILVPLIIAQRSSHFLETLSLCLYDQVSLKLEKLFIQCLKLFNINENHNSQALCAKILDYFRLSKACETQGNNHRK